MTNFFFNKLGDLRTWMHHVLMITPYRRLTSKVVTPCQKKIFEHPLVLSDEAVLAGWRARLHHLSTFRSNATSPEHHSRDTSPRALDIVVRCVRLLLSIPAQTEMCCRYLMQGQSRHTAYEDPMLREVLGLRGGAAEIAVLLGRDSDRFSTF